jgi:hypothetical protein
VVPLGHGGGDAGVHVTMARESAEAPGQHLADGVCPGDGITPPTVLDLVVRAGSDKDLDALLGRRRLHLRREGGTRSLSLDLSRPLSTSLDLSLFLSLCVCIPDAERHV